MLGTVAQMERRFIRERQREGIARAKAAGIYLGGKSRLDRERIRALSAEDTGPAAIARALGCSRMCDAPEIARRAVMLHERMAANRTEGRPVYAARPNEQREP